MHIETITEEDTLLIRRMILAPGEAMFWHTDVCRRFTVVVRGERIGIEHADDGSVFEVDLSPGTADWDEPHDRVHRARNLGNGPYEEVVTFFRSNRSVEPQPRAEADE